jgi:hypothetical protein
MRYFKAVILFVFFCTSLHSQAYIINPQFFEWDTELSLQGSPAFNNTFARLLAYDEGFCIVSRRYIEPNNNLMLKELHFFDSEMNYFVSHQLGNVGAESGFETSEDFFFYNGNIYTLEMAYNYNNPDSLNSFHCFSRYSPQGQLIASDSLFDFDYFPFYSGNDLGLESPTRNKYISGEYVYYLSNVNSFFNVKRKIVRCNLNTAQFDVISFDSDPFATMTSFLGADSSSFLIENFELDNDLRKFYINKIDYDGNVLFSKYVGEVTQPNSIRTYDVINESTSDYVFYRGNSETEMSSLDFLDEDYNFISSIDLHGNEYNRGQFLHATGSNLGYLILLPKIPSDYNYRLIEFDITAHSILFDSTFEVPFVFRPLINRQLIINNESGDFIQYGNVFRENQNLPFFHRINVEERQVFLDSISIPYNDTFQNTDFINIVYKNGNYFMVGYDQSSPLDNELSSYCFGLIDFATSISISAQIEPFFNISPNPVNDDVFITNLPQETLQIQILDLQGRILHSQPTNKQNTVQLLVEELSTGVYLVSVQGKNEVKTKKFIKN